MPITAERLSVDVVADTSKAEDGLDKFSGKTEKAGKGIGVASAAVGAFAGAAVAGFAGKTIMAASDLNETVSKTGVVFGDQTSLVTGYAQQMADDFGLPKTAMMDAASSFGLLGSAAGLAGKPLADMSTGLAGLAADATSFYNVPLDQVLNDFSSALSGESEPVKKYGILMNEAAVQAEALALGLVKPTQNSAALTKAQTMAGIAQNKYNEAVKKHGKNSDEAKKAQLALAGAQDKVALAAEGIVPPLTEGQKVQARTSLITKGMSKAQGDLARTQGSVSNRMREAQGRIQNYAADIGQRALPMVAALLGALIGLIDGLSNAGGFIQEHSTLFKVLGGIIGTIVLPIVVAWGVQSTIAAAKTVAAWATSTASAIAGGWAHVGAAGRIVAGWVSMGLAAVKSGAQTVAIWTMYKVEAAKAAAAQAVTQARILASWIAMKVSALANAAQMALAWTIGIIRQAAVAAASMAVTAARVVAGWVLMGVQSLIQAARMAAAWVIAMGPVGWIIALIVGLVILIIANWDKVKAVTIQVFDAIMAKLAAAWGWIKSTASATWEWLKATISNVLAGIKAAIVAYFNAYKAVILAVWNAIKSAASAAWNGIKALISGALGAIRSAVSSALSSVRSTFTSGWNAAKSTVSSAWSNIKGAVSGGINNMMALVRGIPGKIKGALSGMGRLLYDSGAAIIRGLADGIRNGLGNVTSAVKGVLSAARNLLPFSPAKEGPFSGKGWTLYSGRSISEALAEGMGQRTGDVSKSALALARAAMPPLQSPGDTPLGGYASTAVRAAQGGSVASPDVMRTGSTATTAQNVTFNTYYPIAEKQSQATNRALQHVANLNA